MVCVVMGFNIKFFVLIIDLCLILMFLSMVLCASIKTCDSILGWRSSIVFSVFFRVMFCKMFIEFLIMYVLLIIIFVLWLIKIFFFNCVVGWMFIENTAEIRFCIVNVMSFCSRFYSVCWMWCDFSVWNFLNNNNVCEYFMYVGFCFLNVVMFVFIVSRSFAFVVVFFFFVSIVLKIFISCVGSSVLFVNLFVNMKFKFCFSVLWLSMFVYREFDSIGFFVAFRFVFFRIVV